MGRKKIEHDVHTTDCFEVDPLFVAGGLGRPPSPSQLCFIIHERGVFRIQNESNSAWEKIIHIDPIRKSRVTCMLPQQLTDAGLAMGVNLKEGNFLPTGVHYWPDIPDGERFIFLTSSQPYHAPPEVEINNEDGVRIARNLGGRKRGSGVQMIDVSGPSPGLGWVRMGEIVSSLTDIVHKTTPIYVVFDTKFKVMVYQIFHEKWLQNELLRLEDVIREEHLAIGTYFAVPLPSIEDNPMMNENESYPSIHIVLCHQCGAQNTPMLCISCGNQIQNVDSNTLEKQGESNTFEKQGESNTSE
jgi:hypothetical protein